MSVSTHAIPKTTGFTDSKNSTTMTFIAHHTTPLGPITLASDGDALTGLWFDGQKYFAKTIKGETTEAELPIFQATRLWLDTYFHKERPTSIPKIKVQGSVFLQMVCEIMLSIPYGKTTTYGEIAKVAAQKMGRASMSAQAVGGAVGHNPISIIIPCHRVVGSNGNLTGYAGGLEKKIRLLQIENIII